LLVYTLPTSLKNHTKNASTARRMALSYTDIMRNINVQNKRDDNLRISE